MKNEKSQELSYIDSFKTFHDRIYLRNYQPEDIRRINNGGISPYLQNHLKLEPFISKKDKLKTLLRPRDMTLDRTRNMKFSKHDDSIELTDRRAHDYAEKDTSMLYNPNFRASTAMGSCRRPKKLNQEEQFNKSRENSFKLRLQQNFGGKLDKQAWTQTMSSLNKMDPYIDGFAETGKLERSSSPAKGQTLSNKEIFQVPTSRSGYQNQFQNTISNDGSQTLRQFEEILSKGMNTSMKMSTQNASTHYTTSRMIRMNEKSQSPQRSSREMKIYFKSLEKSQAYHQNKKAVKEKFIEETTFSNLKSPMRFESTFCTSRQSQRPGQIRIRTKTANSGATFATPNIAISKI